jgi:L,D-peptidoglycan transpeptidase YkuD (ErfK/YbiS/YcfS/YnhG family)
VKRTVSDIHVRAISLAATRGMISCGGIALPCSIGRSGRSHRKVEGDGATPVGRWTLRHFYWRVDRGFPPKSLLQGKNLRRDFGWCDDREDRNYNRPVRLPYGASHEEMCRADSLYDVVVTLSHNERPRISGGGSAVFFHLAGPGRAPTAGCVAVSARDMRTILRFCGPTTRLVVWPVTPLKLLGDRKLPNQPGYGLRQA